MTLLEAIDHAIDLCDHDGNYLENPTDSAATLRRWRMWIETGLDVSRYLDEIYGNAHAPDVLEFRDAYRAALPREAK